MATAYRVPSRLEHDVRSARQLVNDSHETAEVVTLTSGSPVQSRIIVDTQPQDVQPHSAIHFVVTPGMGAGNEWRTVTCRRPGEKKIRTWRHPIPPPRET